MWDNQVALLRLANTFLIATVVLLLFAGTNWLVHSSLFPIRSISIEGHLEKVTQEQLRYVAAHELSGTFFTLNIDQIRMAFERLPWVDQVQLRRRWPDRLEINIAEHQAIARWGKNGLVDVAGKWFDAASDEDLPVMVGPAGSEKRMAQAFTMMMKWLQPLGLKPAQIELTYRGAWQVVLTNKVVLKLGRCDAALLLMRIRRFSTHWHEILSRNSDIRYVDMRYQEGFAINVSP